MDDSLGDPLDELLLLDSLSDESLLELDPLLDEELLLPGLL